MKEADFVRSLLKNMNGAFHRNHGSRYGTAGLPDIEGCYRGESIVIECKIGVRNAKTGFVSLASPLTAIQLSWLERYANAGMEERGKSLIAVLLNKSKQIIFFNLRTVLWMKEASKPIKELPFASRIEFRPWNFELQFPFFKDALKQKIIS